MTLINPEFALEHITSESYYKRQTDEFATIKHGKLSQTTYSKILNELATEVVTNSIVTKVVELISQLLTTLTTDASTQPIKTDYEVEINTYPFTLPEEIILNLAQALHSKLHKLFPVSIVSLDYKNLNAELIQSQYPCFILYDSTYWFNSLEKEIVDFKLQNIHMYAPRLNFIRNFNSDENENLEQGMDPFAALELAMGPWVDVNFIPVSLFCADTPSNRVEYY